MIKTGGTYFLDVSSITSNLAERIEKEVVIYTHSLDVTNSLSTNPRVTCHLLGGKFFPKHRFFHSLAEISVLENIYFDAIFIGAAGLKDGYVRFEDEEDAQVKRKVFPHAETKILLAEQAKFEQISTYAIGKVKDFDYFITDKMPDEKQLALFKKQSKIIV